MMNFPNFPWFHPKIIENLRIASYLSFAANACGAAVNSGALCAGDWTALMANFGEMATVGAAVKEDCDFGKAGAASRRFAGQVGWGNFIGEALFGWF
jgi:hypothetical protein